MITTPLRKTPTGLPHVSPGLSRLVVWCGTTLGIQSYKSASLSSFGGEGQRERRRSFSASNSHAQVMPIEEITIPPHEIISGLPPVRYLLQRPAHSPPFDHTTVIKPVHRSDAQHIKDRQHCQPHQHAYRAGARLVFAVFKSHTSIRSGRSTNKTYSCLR